MSGQPSARDLIPNATAIRESLRGRRQNVTHSARRGQEVPLGGVRAFFPGLCAARAKFLSAPRASALQRFNRACRQEDAEHDHREIKHDIFEINDAFGKVVEMRR